MPRPPIGRDRQRPSGGRGLACALVGRNTLLLDALGAMLQLRRGLRFLPRQVGGDGAASSRAVSVGLIVVDLDGLEPGDLQNVRATCDGAAEVRLLLITATARDYRRPAWLTTRRHVVVGRDESLEALFQKLDGLFAEWVADGSQTGDGRLRNKPLTEREAEVVSLLREGLTTKEIATALGLSAHTVQTHRKRIAEKLGRLGPPIVCRLMGRSGRSG